MTPPLPPRIDRAATPSSERHAIQNVLAWPVSITLLLGAALVYIAPRLVPSAFAGVAVGAAIAVTTFALVFLLALLVERWLHRHALDRAHDAELLVQAVGVAGLPAATANGALTTVASAYADAGARAALAMGEREAHDMLARLGSDGALALERAAARHDLPAFTAALRRVTAPIRIATNAVDVVAEARNIGALVPDGSVTLQIDTDHAHVTIDRTLLREHLTDLIRLAQSATTGHSGVTLHVSRIFRSALQETPVRRTGDSPLTIVPRASGDALRAWVLRAQPGAELLSIIVTDAGSAPSHDEQLRAFDPFAIPRPGDPFGVTLAAIRRTVNAARGTIWIDGAREGGTAVHLLLPITTV